MELLGPSSILAGSGAILVSCLSLGVTSESTSRLPRHLTLQFPLGKFALEYKSGRVKAENSAI